MYRKQFLIVLLFFRGGLTYRTDHSQRSDFMLSDDNNPDQVPISLNHWLTHEFTFGQFAGQVKLAALKVPTDFDATSLFTAITAPGQWDKETADGSIVVNPVNLSGSDSDSTTTVKQERGLLDSRPHPFRLQTGARTALLLVAYPPFFRNQHLDMLIARLKEFDTSRGAEFHPRFFDWEKQKWVSLRNWKGCSI